MTWVEIKNHADWKRVAGEFDWQHAFVRESYVQSPSYVDPADYATIAPDAPPDLMVLVTAADSANVGMEFHFRATSECVFWFAGELVPLERRSG